MEDTRKEIPKIGKGKNMSIAKAGLIIYFEQNEEGLDEFDVGVPDPLHRIVDVAGCRHASFFTPKQVMARLYNSPFFDRRTVFGLYKGIRGNWKTICVKPSQKGINYYNQKLKQKK